MTDTSQITNPKFIITEIAPSRKEIRVIARYDGTEDIPFNQTFINEFNSALEPQGSYTYDWVVTSDVDENISIKDFNEDDIITFERSEFNCNGKTIKAFDVYMCWTWSEEEINPKKG